MFDAAMVVAPSHIPDRSPGVATMITRSKKRGCSRMDPVQPRRFTRARATRPSPAPDGRRSASPLGPLPGQRAVAVAEAALHEHRIDPTAELEADRIERADLAKAELAMERDRGRIRAIADDGDH